MSIFSSKLQFLRETAGESQDQVAEAADISRVAYTRYENGTREPKASTAIKLAQHFNTTVEKLFNAEDENDSSIQLPDVSLRLSEHEKSIIRSYRAAQSSKQEAICDILHIDHPAMLKAN